MAQVMPKELNLKPLPTMPGARSYLFKQQSTQSNYSPGSTIQINIPRLQKSYLSKDSYLKLNVTPSLTHGTGTFTAGTKNLYFDTVGAFGLISKIEVYDYLVSSLLESTSNFNSLISLLIDTSINTNEAKYHWHTLGSTGGDLGSKVMSVAYGSATQSTTSTGIAFDVALPLFSFLGLLSDKFAPLHNGFTIAITLASANEPFIQDIAGYTGETAASNPIGWTVNSAYMCCQVLELGPVAESLVLSSSAGGPLVVPSKAFRNFVGSISSGATSYKMDLNLNVLSMTNVNWIMREAAAVSSAYKRSLSYRHKNTLTSWYLQYGSSMLPQTSGITGWLESYCELVKSRHQLTVPNMHALINGTNFVVDSNTYNAAGVGTSAGYSTTSTLESTTAPVGKFALGLHTELVPGRSQDLIAGLNTNGMVTSIIATFTSVPVDTSVSCWCEYNSFISVIPGIQTTVSF